MKSLDKLKTKFQVLSIILFLIQGFCNRSLVKEQQKYATEQNLMEFGQQGRLEGESEEFISEEKVSNLVNLLKKKRHSSNFNELIVGDIKIRIVSKKNISFPKIVLDVEFGNQLNPLYYNSISSSDRCLLMLGWHFQSHLRQVFESYLSRASFIKSERHIYLGETKYYLESKKFSLKEIELILNYIAVFFSRNIINSSGIVRNYLMDLQVNGNRYFMPDNYMKNLFLTVLNDKFKGSNYQPEGFRDIYGDLKICSNIKNVRNFTKKYEHYFKRRIKKMEIFLNKERISTQKLGRIIRHSFRKIHTSKINFDHLKFLRKTNPFSELTGGILQINSNRVNNKVTLMFPIIDQIGKRAPEVVQFLDKILTKSALIDTLFTKQKWILEYSYEFENNSENMYTNLLLNFISNRPLNSSEELLKFNLTNIIEIWLQILNTSNLNIRNLRKSNEMLDPDESDSQFESILIKCLGIDNMVIIIYSNKPISIKGVDILNLNAKIDEDRYWYFIRKLYSISYLIRKYLLPKFGIKYLLQKEDYYFGTKYVYNNVPSSLIRYFQWKYSGTN
ncbi:uncharacterized protein ELE39_001532 [Cryptosporidium sp. chipmunk genotype I]|uniref:uncharacterized protein n=1 Tax=Cryptosporidium sp. chipmunk genotype I TaxID=1280935 RepID=UPI00351A5669|nr:hypothetical protein ELE39_001532 [Cryptosporidium sp. chipmunk genotype I]